MNATIDSQKCRCLPQRPDAPYHRADCPVHGTAAERKYTPSIQKVHYIRAWSGKRSDELPICGAALDVAGLNRTLIPNTHYSDGRPMAICPNCARLIAARSSQGND